MPDDQAGTLGGFPDSPATTPLGEPQLRQRDPLRDTPPFLSWRAIYAIVLGALAVETALGAILTALFS